MSRDIGFLAADWPAPAAIRAGTTLRAGGVSAPPFDSLNLGDRAGDDPQAVVANRARLVSALDLPVEPAWLYQVHGTRVVDADRPISGAADASVGTHAGTVCAALTADCLPVLLCDRAGSCWGAAHAGWRGLAAGVVEAAVAAMPADASDIMAWLGPAIGAQRFEVGEDVWTAFCDPCGENQAAFEPAGAADKYLADIYGLARIRLRAIGVDKIYGGGLCTMADSRRFYSYRRSRATGRMASLVWRSRAF